MSFEADGKPDLVRRLKQEAYHKAAAGVDVETTDEWLAAIEIEAWRSTNPQFYFDPSANAVFRRPETMPPWERPTRN